MPRVFDALVAEFHLAHAPALGCKRPYEQKTSHRVHASSGAPCSSWEDLGLDRTRLAQGPEVERGRVLRIVQTKGCRWKSVDQERLGFVYHIVFSGKHTTVLPVREYERVQCLRRANEREEAG